MHIRLTVTAGPHQGRVYTFEEHDTFIVGRSRRAHFRLPVKDEYFSRLHFLVEVNPPHCRLVDLKSKNGTHVNGRLVETADLHDGDLIKAGRTEIQVALESPAPVNSPSTCALTRIDEPADTEPSRQSTMPPDYTLLSPAGSSLVQPVSRTCLVCGANLSSDKVVCALCEEQMLKQPQPIAGYRVVRELGRGGMGIVYLAVRTSDAALTALKTVAPSVSGSEREMERFLREARILQQLRHPHIVAFHEMGTCNGRLFFAMDYVRGEDASQLLKKTGPLPVGRGVRLVCQLLEALDYAHSQGFVHRDIKPANLLVTEAGAREEIRLADFGLARVYQASRLSGLTMLGDVGGSVPYMAPEQITRYREVKPPVDQYSAAATLYRLLTGYYIYDFTGDRQRRFMQILEGAPVPLRQRRGDVPQELADIIQRALEREPENRFPSVQALREALAKFE
jgi:serine/threonine-protein kinase